MLGSETVSTRVDIVKQTYSRYINDGREARRFKYLAIYLLNDWITKNGSVQKQMAYATQENPQISNSVFFNIYIISSIFNESVG